MTFRVAHRHYGNYPQIEDGVGMVRTFVNAFERFLSETPAVTGGLTRERRTVDLRTHAAAMVPAGVVRMDVQPPAIAGGTDRIQL